MKATAKKQSVEREIESALARFGMELGLGLKHIENAARIYAECVNEYGSAAEAIFKRRYAGVSENTWDKLRLVGNGDATSRILLMSDSAATKFVRMTKAEQDAVAKDPDGVKVYNEQTRKMEFVRYADIAPRHERILFDERGHARSEREQRDFVEAHPRPMPARPTTAYTIEGDTLVVLRRCRIGRNELKKILARMGA